MTASTSYILAIDVGTGSVRAGLVDARGALHHLATIPHNSHYPRHGWVEQAPEDWWSGAVSAIRETIRLAGATGTIEAVVCCGQMHAPVLLDDRGQLALSRVPLWNDKRAAATAARINAHPEMHIVTAINPATSAWPGIKLAWMAEHQPRMLARAAVLLTPKDYLNYRLSGEVAMDWTEAGSSGLSNLRTRTWSTEMAAALSVPEAILPPLITSDVVVGQVTSDAARETGLSAGTPVFCGAGDFPAAVLGSGVTRPGQCSDITGTSFLLTQMAKEPVRHPQTMNVAMTEGGWGAFAVVDAAGDAVRWARQALERDRRGFASLSTEADTVPPGSNGLFFLPYLTGERLGQGEGSRAAFIGLTARHSAAHMHRAILEGVVLAMRQAFQPIAEATSWPQQIISAAGGARSHTWLQIKADILKAEIIPVRQAEAGLVGCAAIAWSGLGRFATPADAAAAIVRFRRPIRPIAANSERYDASFAAFSGIRVHMHAINKLAGQSE